MRIIITYMLLSLFTRQALCQHFDTVHLQNSTVTIGAYDDYTVIKQGDSLFMHNEIKGAVEKYTMVIELSPTNEEAVSKRAFAYLQLDNYEKSLVDYNTAIKINEANYVSFSNRALVKWYLKDYYGAIGDCNIAIQLNSKYAFAYFHKGISYFELSEYKKAIDCYDQAILLDDKFSRAFCNRGNAKFELNDSSGACDDWYVANLMGNKMADSMREKYCILLSSHPLIFGQSSKDITYSTLENKIIDTIIKLKEVRERAKYIENQTKDKRRLQYSIWKRPTKTTPYYWVKVLEDNGSTLYTHFNFYVYPNTMNIKYLDTVSDEVLDLKTWRKRGSN